jgi:HAD superfamily hydrolase (TIGR01549 family)
VQRTLDCFLSVYKDKRIAVYGTGLNAERIIRNVKGYSFSCVISNDENMIGATFFGIKVLALKDALTCSDIVLVAAIPASTRIVFERIKDDIPSGIKVFDLSGNELNAPKQYENHKYWNIRYQNLIDAIDAHEVISFDVFDTLLMRKCLYPKNVFDIIDLIQVVVKLPVNSSFTQLRQDAERALYTTIGHPTIYEIYDKMALDFDITKRDISCLLELELETERRIMSRREEVFNAFKYALEKCKQVFITSDMYLTKNLLDDLLRSQGIIGYKDILVSCDHGCNKASGKLFNILQETSNSNSILHIGDNFEADIEGARRAGIDAFQIWGGVDLLLNSSVAYLISKVDTICDELLLGEILASVSMFNSPFRLGENRGKINIESIKEMTALSFVPITLGYMSWLIGELRGRKDDAVLFASRDGYLLEKLFDIVKKNHPELNLPTSIYFYSSRKAMAGIIPINEAGILALVHNLDQYRKIDILKHLEKVFGVSFSDNMLKYSGKRYDEIDLDVLTQDLLDEKERIYKKAFESTTNYHNYLESMHLDRYKEIYVVDLVAQGSTRYGLSTLLGKEVKMLTLATTSIPNAFVADPSLATSMYGQLVSGIGRAVGALFPLLELAYASKEGQVLGFCENGSPLFDESTKYNPVLLDGIQEEASQYFEEFFGKDWFMHDFSNEFAESMLGILDSVYSDVSDDVRQLFDFFDPMYETMERFNVLDEVRGDGNR